MNKPSLKDNIITFVSIGIIISALVVFFTGTPRDFRILFIGLLAIVPLLNHLSKYYTSPVETVTHSINIRKEFEKSQKEGNLSYGNRIVIRNIEKHNNYPEVEDTGTISDWFRLEFYSLDPKGVVFMLRNTSLINEPNIGLRVMKMSEHSTNPNRVACTLCAIIPYSSINQIHWDGDEYEPYPHVYCHFNIKKEPYLKMYYAQHVETARKEDHILSEIIDHKEVIKNTRKYKLSFKFIVSKIFGLNL